MTTPDIPLTSTLRVADQVLTRRAAGETVLMNLGNEQYYSLEGPGSRLWELVENKATFGGAISSLLDEYDVEHDELLRDMSDLVHDLSANGLVLIDPA